MVNASTDLPECSKCGQVHDRCSGHKRGVQPLTPCRRIPKKGHKACRLHGGATPRAAKKAERLNAEEEARKQLEAMGRPKPHNLALGILEEISWSKGHLEYIRDQISQLDDGDIIWGIVEHSDKTGGEDWGIKNIERAGVNVWVKLYQEERKIYLDLVKSAHAMGIEERRINLAEKMGANLLRFAALFATRIIEGLDRLGWDRPELEEVWEELVREEIRGSLQAMKEIEE